MGFDGTAELRVLRGTSGGMSAAEYARRWEKGERISLTALDIQSGEVVWTVPRWLTRERRVEAMIEIRGPGFFQHTTEQHQVLLCEGAKMVPGETAFSVLAALSTRHQRCFGRTCLEQPVLYSYAGHFAESDHVGVGRFLLAYGGSLASSLLQVRPVAVVDCEVVRHDRVGPVYEVGLESASLVLIVNFGDVLVAVPSSVRPDEEVG